VREVRGRVFLSFALRRAELPVRGPRRFLAGAADAAHPGRHSYRLPRGHWYGHCYQHPHSYSDGPAHGHCYGQSYGHLHLIA